MAELSVSQSVSLLFGAAVRSRLTRIRHHSPIHSFIHFVPSHFVLDQTAYLLTSYLPPILHSSSALNILLQLPPLLSTLRFYQLSLLDGFLETRLSRCYFYIFYWCHCCHCCYCHHHRSDLCLDDRQRSRRRRRRPAGKPKGQRRGGREKGNTMGQSVLDIAIWEACTWQVLFLFLIFFFFFSKFFSIFFSIYFSLFSLFFSALDGFPSRLLSVPARFPVPPLPHIRRHNHHHHRHFHFHWARQEISHSYRCYQRYALSPPLYSFSGEKSQRINKINKKDIT